MMEKIYAYSNRAGKHTAIAGKYLYLFLRTVVVAAISLAAFLMLVCGWITLGYGFFGGILTLMRR